MFHLLLLITAIIAGAFLIQAQMSYMDPQAQQTQNLGDYIEEHERKIRAGVLEYMRRHSPEATWNALPSNPARAVALSTFQDVYYSAPTYDPNGDRYAAMEWQIDRLQAHGRRAMAVCITLPDGEAYDRAGSMLAAQGNSGTRRVNRCDAAIGASDPDGSVLRFLTYLHQLQRSEQEGNSPRIFDFIDAWASDPSTEQFIEDYLYEVLETGQGLSGDTLENQSELPFEPGRAKTVHYTLRLQLKDTVSADQLELVAGRFQLRGHFDSEVVTLDEFSFHMGGCVLGGPPGQVNPGQLPDHDVSCENLDQHKNWAAQQVPLDQPVYGTLQATLPSGTGHSFGFQGDVWGDTGDRARDLVEIEIVSSQKQYLSGDR